MVTLQLSVYSPALSSGNIGCVVFATNDIAMLVVNVAKQLPGKNELVVSSILVSGKIGDLISGAVRSSTCTLSGTVELSVPVKLKGREPSLMATQMGREDDMPVTSLQSNSTFEPDGATTGGKIYGPRS